MNHSNRLFFELCQRWKLPVKNSKHSVEGKDELRCTKCGATLRRLSRKGFLQDKIYSWFGYYPWECPYCRVPLMLKKRTQRQHKKHRIRASDAD